MIDALAPVVGDGVDYSFGARSGGTDLLDPGEPCTDFGWTRFMIHSNSGYIVDGPVVNREI